MNWFDKVSEYILQNLEGYAYKFLHAGKVVPTGKGYFINSCPFCGHNDCLSITSGVNAGHCFSCNEKGNLVQLVERLVGNETEARNALAEWSGIKYVPSDVDPQRAAAKEKADRMQLLYTKAIEFYQGLLDTTVQMELTSIKPIDYMRKIRKHLPKALIEFKVGYSGDGSTRKKLREHLSEFGFSDDEIKTGMKEMVGIPPGYIIFPYFDMRGNLIRINCKLFARYCWGRNNADGKEFCNHVVSADDKISRDRHEDATKHQMAPDNFSRGDKLRAFFTLRKERRKKRCILVEGENDVISVWETLQYMPEHKDKFTVAGFGGNIPEGMFSHDFLRQFDEIYEAFDNDEAGDKYRDQLNREMPDVQVRKIDIPVTTNETQGYKDIDEFLKDGDLSVQRDLFEEIIDQAKRVETHHFIIWRDKHTWFLKNRDMELHYSIDYYNRRTKGFSGVLKIVKNGIPIDKKNGDIEKVKIAGGAESARLKAELAERIEKYYNDVRWVKNEPQKAFNELLDIFKRTSRKEEVIKQIAWYLHKAEQTSYESMVDTVRRVIVNDKDIANILKEVNGYDNQAIDPYGSFKKIQLSQAFFPLNHDAFMYFTKLLMDGDTPKRVPYLITNKKEEIRLDLLKRKDPQSLLLLKNKYELPMEVEANLVDNVDNLSLQHEWVDKWVNDDINEEDLSPSKIVNEIESFIRSTYIASERVYKVLALWLYATYYYTLFRSGFPYLVFTGSKGSGKSTLDLITLLLSFNPTYALSTTEAALFRMISVMGGTFILDEQENLNDSKKVNENGLATVLKGGYSDTGGDIFRVDSDTKRPVGFNAFGPKVISNINGVEDVIADRCIFIDTFAATHEQLEKLDDPFEYRIEKRREIHSITSRAAISALIHFKTVYNIFQTNTRLNTGNARLSQLLRPLMTMAKFVGGDYEEHLLEYYKAEIADVKKDVALSTLEGKIKHVLESASKEILGLTKDRWVTDNVHVYDKPVEVDRTSLTFELNTLHLKVLTEELDTTKDYPLSEINGALKRVMGRGFNLKKDAKDTRATIVDEQLQRKMNGNKHPRVYSIIFKVRDFISTGAEKAMYKSNEETEESLF